MNVGGTTLAKGKARVVWMVETCNGSVFMAKNHDGDIAHGIWAEGQPWCDEGHWVQC